MLVWVFLFLYSVVVVSLYPWLFCLPTLEYLVAYSFLLCLDGGNGFEDGWRTRLGVRGLMYHPTL